MSGLERNARTGDDEAKSGGGGTVGVATAVYTPLHRAQYTVYMGRCV